MGGGSGTRGEKDGGGGGGGVTEEEDEGTRNQPTWASLRAIVDFPDAGWPQMTTRGIF